MRLHVLYRSYGGENDKNRPPYYSKRLSLQSFLRALSAAPGLDVSFINNGPVPAELLELMQRTGAPVLQIDLPTSRTSFRYAQRYVIDSDWADDDVVFFCEDDYLHTPESLAALDEAVHALPEVSYFLPYGSTRAYPLTSLEHFEECTPKGWQDGTATDVDGQAWRPALAPTSTFAARVGAIRQDYGIFVQSQLPYRNRYLDLEGGLVTQGYEPYLWSDLARGAVGRVPGGMAAKARAVALTPFKVAFNLRAHRRADRRRTMFVAEPNLITHLETEHLSPGPDWAGVASDTQRWFDEGGLQELIANRERAAPDDRPVARGWG
jgi:hypothetical protein